MPSFIAQRSFTEVLTSLCCNILTLLFLAYVAALILAWLFKLFQGFFKPKKSSAQKSTALTEDPVFHTILGWLVMVIVGLVIWRLLKQ